MGGGTETEKQNGVSNTNIFRAINLPRDAVEV